MPSIEDIFEPHTARASGFADYEPGDVAYVTNGFRDNGVLGFVAHQGTGYWLRHGGSG